MRLLPLVPLLVALSSPALLRAQETTSEPAKPPTSSETTALAPGSQTAAGGAAVHPSHALPEPLPEPLTPALDTLAGHLTLAAGAGLTLPFGRLDSRLSQSRRVGPGLALQLSGTYGVSRMVALGIWGDMQRLSDGSGRDDSSGTGFGVGALAVYHLVQGVRFDPWLAAGLGYRTMTVTSDAPDAAYGGPELLHLAVGGDWYATSLFGLGPALELSAGTFTTRPEHASSAHAYWQARATLRFTLDLPGK